MNRLASLLFAIATGCSSGADARPAALTPPDPPRPDASLPDVSAPDARPEAAVDGRADDASVDATATDDASVVDSSGLPQDVAFIEDFGMPAPGTRVEGLIGPEGGTLRGAIGSALDGVTLVVPKGALVAPVTFALDLLFAPGAPPGGKVVSPYVRVGPEGVAFASPATLTLPWKSTDASPQLGAVTRVGYVWSSLGAPSGDDKTLSFPMRRSGPAVVVQFDLTGFKPAITAAIAAGSTLFVEGSNFGLTQVLRPGVDGGASSASQVTVDGVAVETLGWSDTSLSVRLTGDAGVTVVSTPGGTATFP
jgi:hypothetical protein